MNGWEQPYSTEENILADIFDMMNIRLAGTSELPRYNRPYSNIKEEQDIEYVNEILAKMNSNLKEK